MTMSNPRWSAADLDGFRQSQRLACRCAETIASQIVPGMTEDEVAARMKDFLLAEGADDCFHQPSAWFGDRTAFRAVIGFKHLGGFNPAFHPSNHRLEENMPFILDCAPTRNGYTADIGYCCVIGENNVLDRLMDDLVEYRFLIVDMVRRRKTLAEVSQAVDHLCEKHGYEPRHKACPFEVLAHRVEKLANDGKPSHVSIARFGVRNITALLEDRVKGAREGWSPLRNIKSASEHAPTPGLQAVEPHQGFRGAGAKWEELLVIAEDDAYWLDDEVPQVQRWKARGLWPSQRVRKAA